MTLLKSPIAVGDDAWICAEAFVGPGVTIGDRAIAAARAVVVNDVPGDVIVGGNPASLIKRRPQIS
jgi:putative colanic acid biosynthesis acetyltransferase WcaF